MGRVLATVDMLVPCAGCYPHGKASGPPADLPDARPPAQTAGDAPGLAEFGARLKEYAALHERLQKALPSLAKDANPAAILPA
jgi:hypothetical protein